MRKFSYFVIAFIIAILCFGCASGPKTYTVKRETGLYTSLESTDFSETVSKGTKVMPADGADNIICKYSEVEPGIKLCKIEIVNSGKIGWILKNALDF